MPRSKRKSKARKKGYRRFLSLPRKGCKPYKGNVCVLTEISDRNDAISLHETMANPSASSVESEEEGFCGFDVPPYKQGITVLSLFDGIGTAYCALERVGIPVDKYFSSEVDPKALGVLKYHYHNKITNVGCVKTLSEERLDSFYPVHLLVGGSPCQDLSLCNPKRKGLHGPNTSGDLFFEFHRILVYLLKEAERNGHQFNWLFGNTFSMLKETKDEISRCLGSDPVVKCASTHVAMVRRRYFWGNIKNLHSPSDITHSKPHLQDFLLPYRTATVKCLPTITTNPHSQRAGKNKVLPVFEDGNETGLLITEIESLFGLPSHYTDANNLSITDRRKLLGKAWCVPTIIDILKPFAEELKRL